MLAILAMVLAAAAAAADTGTDLTDRQIFQEFLGWYKTYTGSFARRTCQGVRIEA
jgi:hypothetical protein